MGSEVYFFAIDTELPPQALSVAFYCFWRKIQNLCNLLCSLALLYKIGNAQFSRGDATITCVQGSQHWRNDLLEIGIQRGSIGLLLFVQIASQQLLQVGLDQALHVVKHFFCR